jgi:hypothetical protein
MKPLDLDPRERAALALGGLALALVVLLAVYIPMGPKARHALAEGRVAGLQSDLNLAALTRMEERARLDSQEQLRQKLEARPPTFDFFAFVNNTLGEVALTDRAELNDYRTRNSSPKQPMVDLRLSGVSLKELLDLLHRLYSSGNLIVLYKMDQLRPAPNGQGLDCQLTLTTLRL